MKIGFIGAGSLARALGHALALGGHEVVYGVRAEAKLEAGEVPILTAIQAEVVVLAVPFAVVRELLPGLATQLTGKIVIDATNPVNADWSPMLLGQENSAAEEVARALPGARVVKAFNTIFADVLRQAPEPRPAGRVSCFVASDHDEARAIVVELARSAGLAPVEVGPLTVARQLEAMAHLNIQIAVGMKGGTNAAFVYA